MTKSNKIKTHNGLHAHQPYIKLHHLKEVMCEVQQHHPFKLLGPTHLQELSPHTACNSPEEAAAAAAKQYSNMRNCLHLKRTCKWRHQYNNIWQSWCVPTSLHLPSTIRYCYLKMHASKDWRHLNVSNNNGDTCCAGRTWFSLNEFAYTTIRQ